MIVHTVTTLLALVGTISNQVKSIPMTVVKITTGITTARATSHYNMAEVLLGTCNSVERISETL